MTNSEAIKMLTAKRKCIKRETSGVDTACNNQKCDDCELNYSQGTMDEQVEALDTAIKALETVDTLVKQLNVLADTLDGCPLTQPCDKLWKPEGWCEKHCKDGQAEPSKECWLKYAEVMAKQNCVNYEVDNR